MEIRMFKDAAMRKIDGTKFILPNPHNLIRNSNTNILVYVQISISKSNHIH